MTNGPEPDDGSWVIAAYADCPTRVYWQRRGPVWVDTHGCRHPWSELVEPIDCLEPADA